MHEKYGKWLPTHVLVQLNFYSLKGYRLTGIGILILNLRRSDDCFRYTRNPYISDWQWEGVSLMNRGPRRKQSMHYFAVTPVLYMMTSSNGNNFGVTGHSCGEFTSHRWIPPQRPVTRSFDIFFDLRLNKRLSKQWWGWWCKTHVCPSWRHCNVSI